MHIRAKQARPPERARTTGISGKTSKLAGNGLCKQKGYAEAQNTGLEAERTVSGLGKYFPKERRSLGWRWKDPSRRCMEFRILRKGDHWSGGGKIRLGEFLIPRRGAHWSGSGKICLGDDPFGDDPSRTMEFLIPRRGGHWVWRRKDPSRR